MLSIPIQIRFSDVDIFGHVNNSMYNQYLDLGRLAYTLKVLPDAALWQGRTIVVAHIENNYLIPTFMDDTIEVQTCIYETGNKSLKMRQRIVDKDGNIKMDSYSVLSTFDTYTKLSFPLPDEWRAKIEAFEQGATF
ncbi:MAG: acyl-CoA thioesterase [Prevotellaceae bacterium]|jgi:acyl-CoA thioester hydrolase|nr:acyl-CoA thioesterase [Prevotellaceae bacterium]